MRHAAAFCNQFPVTAHIASLILYNPSATADIQEKLLGYKFIGFTPQIITLTRKIC